MAKKQLLDSILNDPTRIYRTPADVLRDRRFADCERLKILKSWMRAAPAECALISAMILQVESRLYPASSHAAE